ncbi:MAG: hypothetical protein ACRDJC_09735 [Thermomicrobiales bacterium]
MRVFLTVGLLVASHLLLLGALVLGRWVIDCGGGACAGTVRAASPFTPPRDVILTALAIAAPYLLAALVVAVTWFVTGRAAARPAATPVPARPEPSWRPSASR